MIVFATTHHGVVPHARLAEKLRSDLSRLIRDSPPPVVTGWQRAIRQKVVWPQSMASETDRHCGRSDVKDIGLLGLINYVFRGPV